MKNQKGNVLIIASVFLTIFLIFLLLIIAIFMSHVNNVLYDFKLDMYSLAKSGIISVNKVKASTNDFGYDANSFKKEFENQIKENYELNDDFTNSDRLISKVVIKEYKIYNKGNRDSYTNKKCSDRMLHIVLDVKIRPIILRSLLENLFVFEIHEDVNLNMVKF